MDFRTEIYHNMDREFRQVVTDLGGRENLSVLELGLVERFVFCSFLVRDCEIKLAVGENGNGNTEKLLENWLHLTGVINSISKKLGIQIRKSKDSKLKKQLETYD